jgi:hypothetical protein
VGQGEINTTRKTPLLMACQPGKQNIDWQLFIDKMGVGCRQYQSGKIKNSLFLKQDVQWLGRST